MGAHDVKCLLHSFLEPQLNSQDKEQQQDQAQGTSGVGWEESVTSEGGGQI